MTFSIRRSTFAVLAAASFVALSLPVVSAQDATTSSANGFKISPVRSELTIEKGDTSTVDISIENPSDIPMVAEAVVNNFIASDDGTGTPRLILDENAEAPKNDFRSLVGEIPNVSLGAKERKDVQVQLSVPQDANSGGYYGAIRFVPADITQESTVGLTASVGTIVLVTVPGDLTQKLTLEDLSAGQYDENKAPVTKSIISKGNVIIVTKLANEGDIHTKPFGNITVKNMFGKTVSSMELNAVEPKANVLPGSTRTFVNEPDYKSWLGRYTITANLGYGDGGGQLISQTSSFWYLPLWSILVIVGIVLLLAIGAYILIRRMSNKGHKSKK